MLSALVLCLSHLTFQLQKCWCSGFKSDYLRSRSERRWQEFSSFSNLYYGRSSLHWTQEACCLLALPFISLVWSLRLQSDGTWHGGKFLSDGKCEAEVFPQKSQLSDEILFKSWNIWNVFSSFQIIESNLWQNYWSVARFPAEPWGQFECQFKYNLVW